MASELFEPSGVQYNCIKFINVQTNYSSQSYCLPCLLLLFAVNISSGKILDTSSNLLLKFKYFIGLIPQIPLNLLVKHPALELPSN